MNPIALIFGLILLAVSVFFVASPFRPPAATKKSTGGGGQPKAAGKPSLEKQHQAVLLALRDLDFDYQAGKVAEEDYQSLRVNLVNEAAQMLQSQGRKQEDSLEALIQSRRQARSTPQRQQPAPSETKAKANGSAEKLCQHCQAPLLAGAKFCSKCGTPVVEIVCLKCKQSLRPDDRFCPSCGTAVPSEKEITKPAARPEGE